MSKNKQWPNVCDNFICTKKSLDLQSADNKIFFRQIFIKVAESRITTLKVTSGHFAAKLKANLISTSKSSLPRLERQKGCKKWFFVNETNMKHSCSMCNHFSATRVDIPTYTWFLLHPQNFRWDNHTFYGEEVPTFVTILSLEAVWTFTLVAANNIRTLSAIFAGLVYVTNITI